MPMPPPGPAPAPMPMPMPMPMGSILSVTDLETEETIGTGNTISNELNFEETSSEINNNSNLNE
jgi:hypothetical protein